MYECSQNPSEHTSLKKFYFEEVNLHTANFILINDLRTVSFYVPINQHFLRNATDMQLHRYFMNMQLNTWVDILWIIP